MGVLDYSTTAGSNTAINGIGIQGTNSVLNFDNALRQLMADVAGGITRVVDKAAGSYTPAKTDHKQLWRATGAATFNLTAAATLTSGWCLWVKADGGAITVDPNAAELVNGAATLTVPDGSSAIIFCTGTAFQAIVIGKPATAGVLTKTAGYTAVAADRGALIRFTTAATLALTAAATLTSDWYVDVAAVGVDVVIDPNSTEQIDGATTLTITAGSWARVYCTGTAFFTALTKVGSETAPGLNEIATAAEIAAAASNLLVMTPGRLKDSLAWFTITYAASIPVAHTNGKNQVVTLTGNGAFAAPSGGIPGETLDIAVIQDGTGNRVPTWNSAYDFGDYGTPVLSTGASQEDILGFKCRTSGKFVFYGMRRRTD